MERVISIQTENIYDVWQGPDVLHYLVYDIFSWTRDMWWLWLCSRRGPFIWSIERLVSTRRLDSWVI